MPADMTLYFDVVKQIQDQINRITYANHLTEQERLNQLYRLEHEISQKFQWARRSVDTVKRRWVSHKEPGSVQDESETEDLSSEMGVA